MNGTEKIDKKQKIQWDEETIAEHDKERGSRQKIDEAPTPYRYQSESDQSECESDAETLAKQDLEDAADAEASTSPRPRPSKKKNVIFNAANPSTMISDSWEAVNAKLQYEKHLQDSGSNSPTPGGASKPNPMAINDSVQRNEFYRNSSTNSNSNIGAPSHNSPKVSISSGGKIVDLQTNFGELLNPAPAAFSPQFTRKGYRTAGGAAGGPGLLKTLSNCSADDEGGASSEDQSRKGSTGTTPDKAPRTVFIKPFGDAGAGPAHADQGKGGDLFAGMNGATGGDDDAEGDGEAPSGEKKQFLNKRAGHYNEYKVLQAMRAKLAAEEDEEDDDC